jgi:hypothetical protein
MRPSKLLHYFSKVPNAGTLSAAAKTNGMSHRLTNGKLLTNDDVRLNSIIVSKINTNII